MAVAQLENKLFFKAGLFPLDGFDSAADLLFQMVPLGGTREIVMSTLNPPAKLSFSREGIALMGNFRDFDTKLPLPDLEENRFVNSFDLPPNRKIQCTVKSVAVGATTLSGVDVPTPGQFDFRFDLIISVKPPLERKFCFVFVSDLVRKSVRGKIEPRFLLDSVKKLFDRQANLQLTDIDAGIDFREVHVAANLGDPLDVESAADGKVDRRVAEVFPDLASQTDFVVYVVWRVSGKHKQLLGVNLQTFTKLNTVYLSLEPPSTADRIHTMAHEFGHAMGLPHALEDCLMFPTLRPSNRLLAGHIEQLHTGPIFPDPPKVPTGPRPSRLPFPGP